MCNFTFWHFNLKNDSVIIQKQKENDIFLSFSKVILMDKSVLLHLCKATVISFGQQRLKTVLNTLPYSFLFAYFLFWAKDCVRYATPRVCKSRGCLVNYFLFAYFLFLAKDCVRYATPRVCKSRGCPVNSFLFAYFLFSVKRK